MITHRDNPDEPPTLYAVPPPPDDDGYDTRTPPHDHDAEQAVLGAMLASPRARDDAAAVLFGHEFYDTRHETIYAAILELHATDQPVDTVTVTAYLEERGEIGRIERIYIHELYTALPAPATAGYYARIVADRAVRRGIIHAGTKIVQLGYSTTAGALDDLTQAVRREAETATSQQTRAATTSTWEPVDLTDVRASDNPRPAATLLTTNTGQGLLYPGAVHSVSGEPTAGKSWVALTAVAQEVAAGHPVLYIDFEDRPETLIARLDDMGADPSDVDRLVRYIRPETAMDITSGGHLDTAAQGCRVAVVDGVTEAMTLHGLDLSKNPDVASWLALLPRRLANHGPAVLQIDHVVKDAEARGRYAIGGQHKLAGIVASYTMVVAKPFAPGKAGHARLVVAKDRHGDVGTVGETVAELHMTPDVGRSKTAVACTLTASTYRAPEADGHSSGPRLTGYMEKVSRVLELNTGMSQKDLLKACGGRETYILSAIQSLTEEGFVRVEKGGAGVATRHFSLAPFREDGDQ